MEILTQDNKERLSQDILIQLLAVFVNRFGGEVVVSEREYSQVEGVDIYALHITPEHLRLKLVDLYPIEAVDDIDEE